MDVDELTDVIRDVRLRRPFNNNTSDVIYVSHVLKHLANEESLYCLQQYNMKP